MTALITPDELAAIDARRVAAEKEIKLPLVVVERAPDGDDGWVDEIDDANGERVVETDCGVYPPARATAHYLAAAANAAPSLVAEVRRLWAERDAKGHCHHAPKCIGKGAPDERDPLGCCNCGTREAETR